MCLIIGCGNLLRGDDAVGPVLVRRLLDRGLPDGVEVADGGTSGMDVAFRMRGARRVVLIDAARSGGGNPGTLYRLDGRDVEQLPALETLNLHSFRWDHALAFARWLLKEDYPEQVVVYLIEAAAFEFGEPLSEPVANAMERLVDRLLVELGRDTTVPS